jgi:hypothetical protein
MPRNWLLDDCERGSCVGASVSVVRRNFTDVEQGKQPACVLRTPAQCNRLVI